MVWFLLVPGNPYSSVSVDYHPWITRRCCNKMPRHLYVGCHQFWQSWWIIKIFCVEKNTWTLFCSMSSPQVKTLCAGLDLLMQRSVWNKILQRTASFNFPTFRRLAWQRGQQRPVQLRVHMGERSKGPWSQSLLARVECWHTNTWFWLYFQN